MHETMGSNSSPKCCSALRAVAFLTSAVLAGGLAAQAAEPTLPHLVRKDGRHTTVAVRYLDTLARTPAGWRIRRRVVRTDWVRARP